MIALGARYLLINILQELNCRKDAKGFILLRNTNRQTKRKAREMRWFEA